MVVLLLFRKCYINAVAQCLAHFPRLRELKPEGFAFTPKSGPLWKIFQNHVRKLFDPDYESPLVATELNNALGYQNIYEDASEILVQILLIPQLSREIGKPDLFISGLPTRNTLVVLRNARKHT